MMQLHPFLHMLGLKNSDSGMEGKEFDRIILVI